MEKYQKENRCFCCGEQGHSYRHCPKKKDLKDTPQVTHILSNGEKEEEDGGHSLLCYLWGKIRDQSTLILLDTGSTHNFISQELAKHLEIYIEELGPSLNARGAFQGQEVPVTPVIGKLRLHINNYFDSEDFFVSPLQTQDIILGAPWFHRVYACLKFPKNFVTISHSGRDFSFEASSKDNVIQIVTNNALKKVMKKSSFAYLVYVKYPPTPNFYNSNDVLNESE